MTRRSPWLDPDVAASDPDALDELATVAWLLCVLVVAVSVTTALVLVWL